MMGLFQKPDDTPQRARKHPGSMFGFGMFGTSQECDHLIQWQSAIDSMFLWYSHLIVAKSR